MQKVHKWLERKRQRKTVIWALKMVDIFQNNEKNIKKYKNRKNSYMVDIEAKKKNHKPDLSKRR